jgi:transposase
MAFHSFPGTEDSETIEIEVRAHRRVIHRKRYRPTCQCPGNAGIIAAPVPPKLIPKGRYGISVWTHVVLDKFLFFRPSHRLIDDLALYGIEKFSRLRRDVEHFLVPRARARVIVRAETL